MEKPDIQKGQKNEHEHERKTVYFSACGIGLGHVGRLKPFARRMHNDGHKVYFTGYGDSLDQLKNDEFTVHPVPKITFYENPDGSFNSVKTSVLGLYLTTRFLKQVKTEYNYIFKYKPDIVISDTRYSTVFAAKKYKMAYAPDMPILFITNQLSAILPTPRELSGIAWFENMFSYLNIRIIGMADHVLVQDLPPPYTISTTSYKVPEWLQYRFQYIGFIIRKTPEQLPSRDKLREKYATDDKPLIYAPLAGPIVARKQLMHLLRDALKDFDGKVIITMGMFGSGIDKKYGNVHVKGWLDDRFELLKAADLTIARPGLATIGDFLRFGVPSILVPTLNHPEQLHNAQSMERLGVGRLLEQQDMNEKNMTNMIHQLIENSAVKSATAKMQKIMIKNDGLKKVRSIIESKLF
jgi:UDP:flavonoid glycosyltransferase YjiC (YdhE family)